MQLPRPRKSFGQHFLRDQAIIERIIGALSPDVRKHYVEIGPGQGALTVPFAHLLSQMAKGAPITYEAIELDRDLVPVLQARCVYAGLPTIHLADALTVDFAALKQDERLLHVFGNLPYNISTPLIFHLLQSAAAIKDMVFMLQKEVGDRLAAKAGSHAYGRLSVMVQYYCAVDTLFDVPPGAFFPPPQVQSTIVRLVPYTNLPVSAQNEAVFAAVVKAAFAMRRKTLRNSLKKLMTDELWAASTVNSDRRAETLSVREFVEISNLINSDTGE